jgi:hypothetical protein
MSEILKEIESYQSEEVPDSENDEKTILNTEMIEVSKLEPDLEATKVRLAQCDREFMDLL